VGTAPESVPCERGADRTVILGATALQSCFTHSLLSHSLKKRSLSAVAPKPSVASPHPSQGTDLGRNPTCPWNGVPVRAFSWELRTPEVSQTGRECVKRTPCPLTPGQLERSPPRSRGTCPGWAPTPVCDGVPLARTVWPWRGREVWPYPLPGGRLGGGGVLRLAAPREQVPGRCPPGGR